MTAKVYIPASEYERFDLLETGRSLAEVFPRGVWISMRGAEVCVRGGDPPHYLPPIADDIDDPATDPENVKRLAEGILGANWPPKIFQTPFTTPGIHTANYSMPCGSCGKTLQVDTPILPSSAALCDECYAKGVKDARS